MICQLSKKIHHQVPRPPSAKHSLSKVRLHRSASRRTLPPALATSLNKNSCLPPVGGCQSSNKSLPAKPLPLPPVLPDLPCDVANDSTNKLDVQFDVELPNDEVAIGASPTDTSDEKVAVSAGETSVSTSEKRLVEKDVAVSTLRRVLPVSASRAGLIPEFPVRHAPTMLNLPLSYLESGDTDAGDDVAADKLRFGTTSRSKFMFPPSPPVVGRKKTGKVKLQSMNTHEVRAMSGMLSNLVNGASPPSRTAGGGFLIPSVAGSLQRGQTPPEHRLLVRRPVRLFFVKCCHLFDAAFSAFICTVCNWWTWPA